MIKKLGRARPPSVTIPEKGFLSHASIVFYEKNKLPPSMTFTTRLLFLKC